MMQVKRRRARGCDPLYCAIGIEDAPPCYGSRQLISADRLAGFGLRQSGRLPIAAKCLLRERLGECYQGRNADAP
jgi:hypothetical protein